MDGDTGGITQAVEDAEQEAGRRVRSTKRRQDVPDLPARPMQDTTLGVVFTAPDGTEHRPSMFLTLTLPSYGKIKDGAPADPASYNYRRAAMDAILFPRLLDQFWKALRRCAGFQVQYFSVIEEQQRLTPHAHAAIRGAIPRETLRQVVKAVYYQAWWPSFERAVYVGRRVPEWTGRDYADPYTGEVLPTWEQAMDAIEADPDAKPAHVMRFGSQMDIQGLVRGNRKTDRAIRYLTKYLTKDIAAVVDPDHASLPQRRHADRLHRELRYLPCSEECANWLRYGVQPRNAHEGQTPGECPKPAHRRENLGLGGRRVLVSRKWSKTLGQHRADRAAVVREALAVAGIVAPDTERIAADVLSNDGQPRYRWEPVERDELHYAQVIMLAVAERQRWRREYEQARSAVDAATRSAVPP